MLRLRTADTLHYVDILWLKYINYYETKLEFPEGCEEVGEIHPKKPCGNFLEQHYADTLLSHSRMMPSYNVISINTF